MSSLSFSLGVSSMSVDLHRGFSDSGKTRRHLVPRLCKFQACPCAGGHDVPGLHAEAAPGAMRRDPGQQAERVAEGMRALRLRHPRADAEFDFLLQEIDLLPVPGAAADDQRAVVLRSEEHTSELQSQ